MEIDRHKKLLIGLGLAATILIVRLFSIQIINDKYKENAENQSLVYETIYPSRGVIYDRNKKILVGNKVAYDILVTPKEIKKFDTLALARALDIDLKYIKERMLYFQKNRNSIGSQPVTLIKQLSPERYMKFAEIQYKFPGFKGQVRSIRDYPINAGGNLLGYVSEVDADYIKNHPGEYRSGDYAGKTGIEAARESDLKGEKGYNVFLRNSHNQIQSSYNNGEMDKEAVPGKDIVTTIDADLQQYGQELMQNKVGSLVAIEPATGEILAMVSSPNLDVSMLADIGKHYNELINDPYRPMFNRAVQAPYPPGSVFKLVNGLIGLQEKVLAPSYTYPCNGGFAYTSTRKLGCHNHPSPLNLVQAIMMSCNGYFCYVFKNILENRKYGSISEAFDVWRNYVKSFGFGEKLESDVPYELAGTIPTSKYYNKIYGKNGWRFATIISLSIGQGEIGVTPLQIANLCATVANRGYYIRPHIVKDSENITIDEKYKEKVYTMVDTSEFAKVVPGMYMAVNGGPGSGGTATACAVPGLDICGKTGTAQNPRGENNSVFMCFAPMDNPKIAIAVYLENAGFGATWACPIASLMVEKYLTGEIREERKYLEENMMIANLMSGVKKD